MMDKLESMFEQQECLQKRLALCKIKNKSDWQQYVNQMVLAAHEEVVEIMRETAYKNPARVKFGWKKGQESDLENMKEEIIDLWHFVMNLSLASGMGPEEFFRRYKKKNLKNHVRQDNGY